MPNLSGKKIAILATNGFEQSELDVPKQRLAEWGAEVHVVSPEHGTITGWNKTDWGDAVKVDRNLGDVTAQEYDALVLPGGQINPDLLRVNDKAITLIRAFFDEKRVIAAICHAPWLLIEAGIVNGRDATSYKSIATDMKNAGANWTDEAVVTDNGIITSRNPGDLEPFCEKIAEEVNEGRHMHRAA